MRFKNIKKKQWFSILTNKYVLILTVFAIWMFFFDTNSFFIHSELKKEIKKLEKQKEFLNTEIKNDKISIKRLTDEEEMEKFAREEYFLKKKNEEIYLIEYADSTKTKKNE